MLFFSVYLLAFDPGESFSTSPVLHLPSRPLLNAEVMPMLLSKELTPSSGGRGLFHSAHPCYKQKKKKNTGPKIWSVLPVTDENIYFLLRESSVAICSKDKEFFTFLCTFSVQVRHLGDSRNSDYQNKPSLCEERHNQFLYLCNTNYPNQRMWKSDI